MRSGKPSPLAALSALGALTLSILPAHADKVPAHRSNDIFIGFRSTENPGSSFAYLVKVGTYSTFANVPEGSSITLLTINLGTTSEPNVVSLGNLGADLSSSNPLGQGFGPNWHTRQSVRWGVFGWSNSVNPVIFASRQRPSAATASDPWAELDSTQRNGTYSEITTVLGSQSSSQNAYNLLDATANSPVGAFQPAGGGTYIEKVSSSPDFGNITSFTDIEANFENGPGNALLDLYRFGPTGGSTPSVLRVGYFSISSSGVITFTKPAAASNPNADDDGDGFTNGQEAVAGTNPNDSKDFFRVNSVAKSTGNSQLSFKPAANRTYVLSYSEDLQPPWQTIETWPAGTSPSSLHTFTDNDPVRTARPKGFYRIVVSQP
ncbi:MAG TPA: thrombospondin type 3 repeat-containing protein [Luteolibacter sp.]|nr:thrombospondin type 3 repeat-containing protein [Luteolibacter sp.]